MVVVKQIDMTRNEADRQACECIWFDNLTFMEWVSERAQLWPNDLGILMCEK